jgi:hypothetical protein
VDLPVAAEEAEVPISHNARKTSLTFQNTKINKSVSVSPAVEKVSTPCYILMTAVGILKGYDQLMNLVLDNVEENLRGSDPR